MKSTAIILGAAGRIGRELAVAFADAGWQVRAQARKPLPEVLSQRGRIHALRCDASDTTALIAAARGATVVINALNPLYTQWDRLALPLADAALTVARASGALLMLPGNVYNFGRELPARLTPNTPERGDTPKARTRIEMESRLAAAALEGVDSVVIRAGDFFGGSGSGTWLDMAMGTQLHKGKFIYPGNTRVDHAWAYLPDLARTFVRVAERRVELKGHHRFHFKGYTLTGEAFKAEIESLVSRPLRSGKLPWAMIRLGSPLVPMWRELLTMRYLWELPHALDDTTLHALVGPLPSTPLPQALRETLAGMDQLSDEPFKASARS